MSMSLWKTIDPKGDKPEARAGHGMCLSTDESSFFLFGGTAKTKYYSDLWQFDLSSKTWKRLGADSEKQPPTRWSCSLTAYGNYVYVVGGEQVVMQDYTTVWRFDLSSGQWEVPEMQGAAPIPRTGHTGNLVPWKESQGILVFGGKNIHTGEELCDTLILQLDSLEWCNPFAVVHGVSIPDENPPRRKRHSAVVYKNMLVVFAGWQGQSNLSGDYWSDLYFLSLDEWAWRHVQCRGTTPAERAGHVAVINDDKMFIWGGWGSTRDMYNELHYLELDDNTWCSFRRGKVPGERIDSTAVIANGQMYVFGGYTPKHEHLDELMTCKVSSVY